MVVLSCGLAGFGGVCYCCGYVIGLVGCLLV